VQVGQVPVPLLEVEAVAHEELVGDGEAHVADRQVFDQPPVGPVEEGYDRERGRVAKRERLAEVVQGQAGVDHVLDDEDVSVGDLGVEILEEPDASVPASVRARGVARELEEVDPMRDAQRPREVGEENEASLQRRDQERLEPLVLPRDVATELADARLQLLAGEVDLPETWAPAYDASSSRYRSARRSMSRL
jgi:hypothetical protein